MPLLWLSLAFLGGVLLGQALALPLRLWLGLAGLIVAVLGLRLWRHRRAAQPRFAPSPALAFQLTPNSILAACLVACLGAARFQAERPIITPEWIGLYNDRPETFVVEGVVVRMPDLRDRAVQLTVQVTQVRPKDEPDFRPASGLLLARVPGSYRLGWWRYGDRLTLTGKIETPFEDESFSYRAYLARHDIYSYMSWAQARRLATGEGNPFLRQLYAFKERLLGLVYRLFPDPEASLLAGILLGVDQGLPEGVETAFQKTGTSHIIAISGFNFAVLSAALIRLTGWLFGKRRGALVAWIGIVLYALLVGAAPAVMRAAVMSSLGLLAGLLGRRQHGLNTLSAVAAGMALFDPNVLWEVGFQLSFMATLGLILYAQPLQAWFERGAGRLLPPAVAQRLSGPVGEFFLFTLAAQVTTLPVIIYTFGRFSLSSFLANPLILPVQPAVMGLGGVAVILGLLFQPLGQLAAWVAWPALVYTIRVVELCARIPGGDTAVGPVSLWQVLLFYALLFGLTLAPRTLRSGALPARLRSLLPRLAAAARVRPLALAGLSLAFLLIANIVAWRAVFAAPDGRLHLTLLDTAASGQVGEALLVQTPAGRRLLIGGGPSPARLSEALGRRLPLGHRKLDWLVVAGVKETQLAALPSNVERFPVGQVLWAGDPQAGRAARDLQRALGQAGVPVTTAQPGQTLDLGDGAALHVLTVCDSGAVLLLEWRSFQALLPIGVDEATLTTLMEPPGPDPVAALLLSQNGKLEANPPEFLRALQPQIALLPAAAGGAGSQPDAEVLAALEGITLLRTDQHGWVEITTDGEQMWVEVAR